MEKFEARFPKIIATTPEKKKKIKEELKKRYLEFREKIAPYEIPRTEKDRYIISDMESVVRKVLKKYKKKPEKPFPIERIYLLRPGFVDVETITRGRITAAFVDPVGRFIVLNRTPSDVETALSFVHERFELGLPTAVKISEGRLRTLWSGITVYDKERERVYFNPMKEAVIAELTNQVYQEEIKKDPLYQKEMTDNERILWWIKKISQQKGWDRETEGIYLSGFYAIPEIVEIVNTVEEAYRSEEEKLAYLGYIEMAISGFISRFGRGGAERIEERIKLAKLINEIFGKSKEPGVQFKFKDRQEIFDEFARAVFTANPLRMRKIIEGTLGKDAFKSFVEEQKENL